MQSVLSSDEPPSGGVPLFSASQLGRPLQVWNLSSKSHGRGIQSFSLSPFQVRKRPEKMAVVKKRRQENVLRTWNG